MAVGLAAGLLVSVAWLPGCAGWDTWPPTDPVDKAPNRDDAAIAQTMTLALGRVIADYPPRGDQNQRVAINLPGPLVGQAVYRRVARNVEAEPGVNRVVEPLSESNMNLPIYHVAGVRVRSGRAEIDILRPIFGVDELQRAELTNERAYEGYTVRLSGGFRPWHVTWVERFTPGVIPTPALNPIEGVPPSGLNQPTGSPEAEPEPEAEQLPEMPAEEPADEPAAEPAADPADEPGRG